MVNLKDSIWFSSFCLLVSAIAFAQTSPSNSRILSGQDAVEGQFPFFASLQVEESHYCGGSILNDHWILTAAHCIRDGNQYSIRVGSVDVNKGRRYNVSEYIVHEGYVSLNQVNDIALLKTEEKIEFNEKVQPIKLHQSNVGGDESVVACGFGMTTEEEISSVLKFVELRSLDHESCKEVLGNTEAAEVLLQGKLCTFTRFGQGVCNRDSGGPLVLNGEQVGIAAWVIGVCGLGFPDGFTRVSLYLDWIEENMK